MPACLHYPGVIRPQTGERTLYGRNLFSTMEFVPRHDTLNSKKFGRF